MRFLTKISGLSAIALAAAGAANAQDSLGNLEVIGKPTEKSLGFQPAATELARDLQGLDNMILVIITAIVIFVTALIIWIMIRYNSKTNPKPATFTHNSPLEVAWTLIPILILVFIGAFSLPVLFKQQTIPTADVTIKATGYQWYWGYEYVDHEFGFDSYMLGHPATLTDDDDGVEPFVRSADMDALLERNGYASEDFLLATDTALVIPVGKTIVIQVTGADVIHSWAIPAFGVKQDGVPGRLAELWFTAEKEGVYFGQCSELCGKDHSYMPITVKVVSEEAYQNWLVDAKEEYAGLDTPLTLASK
ncbi:MULTISPECIES: cytochrome c oxidase subunit II [Halocynthiibacter]|uniref:Cytochrome c oxidase subunit 2 n=1 Tax=Halocynthiibacter halioticoli TaxID=2986804 RepID=A0AAE3LUQ3_9RHOB|nr:MULTISPECIES: cytochrome c oxidase subunit II [Halocynthiibacter]MCV6825255.1 cytochrome c oxidase subunit II [Halocynthiibacter halioticoli]MCW4058256.1 cytochrome c oxidase subunit II [Halocynthiibacter sp. SDUM655004]MDE0588723.1 cytochrome c oxidase subunit II [Halocynthiibacter sp. C4]